MYVLLLGLKWALTQNKFSAAHHSKLSEPSRPGGPYPSPLPDFGKSVNSISTRGNRLCPPHYPRIFRPSYGPAITDSEVVVKRNFILLSFFCCFCSSPLLAEVIMFRLEHQSQIMRRINCHIECFELMRMSGLGLFKVAEVEGGLWIKKWE